MNSQRITEKDIEAGQIRFPRASKRAFPDSDCDVEIVLRGLPLTCAWRPRTGPDRERSGVLLVGRQALEGRVAPDDLLAVSVSGDHVVLT